MSVEIGIPRVCLGLLLFSFNWILLYSANNEFLSYDHFCIFILFSSSSGIVIHLESSEWDKVQGL